MNSARLLPFTLLLAAPLAAQQDGAPSNEELARRIDILSGQLDTSGPSMADRFSFGGYGELKYNRYDDTTDGGAPSGMTDELDLHRVVFYFGYKFDDTWSFTSEIEYEHVDELSIEFAQVDGNFSEALNFRGGHLLIPMGFINQNHDPNTFWSAQRPVVERLILPSTWHENGLGTFGAAGDFSWQAYVVSGFDAAGFNPSGSGLRGGRQKGSNAIAEDLSFTGRLDWQGVEGLTLGGSFFTGNSGQGSTVSDFGVNVMSVHAAYETGPARFRFLYADATIDDANLLPTPSASDDLMGWYIEGGYDLFADRTDGQALIPFVRYSNYDLLDATAASTDVDVIVVGCAYQPQENVIFKLDFKDSSNDADTTVDTFEFTLGWAF